MENKMGTGFANQVNRERGRGRKAFWIIIGAALLIGVFIATRS